SLLEQTITSALTATPNTNNGGGGGNQQRRVQRGGMVIGSGSSNGPVQVFMDPQNQQTQIDPAQVQQSNARNLLRGLQAMLPQIDQYLPERGQTVRQKLTELGMNNTQANFGKQMRNLQGDSESIANGAAVPPPQPQRASYQRA